MAVDLDTLLQKTKAIVILRGGSGSGNWGHAGRPGKRGGSGGGGGLRAIGAKPGSSHKERKEASARRKQKGKKAGGGKPGDKLDGILKDAPKDQAAFTSHLMGKVQAGEISFAEAQELQTRFADKPKTKQFKASDIQGDVKRGKIYDGEELDRGDAKDQWGDWADDLDSPERKALLDYQSEPFDGQDTDYIKINNHLRGKDNNPTKATRAAISNLDSALDKSIVPQDTVAYRGFPVGVLGDNPQSLVGKTISDGGYTSTSLSRRVAEQFSGQVVAEVRIPRGSKGGLIDSLETGKDPEHELLLPRNSNFRVLAVEKVGNQTYVVMELVP